MTKDASVVTSALPGPTDDLLGKLEGIYRDLHANPELSMQEHRTSGIAAVWLREQGYDVTEGVGATGVVGLLRNGDGPVVLLRADMDALPIKESTGLAYASDYSKGGSRAPAPVWRRSGDRNRSGDGERGFWTVWCSLGCADRFLGDRRH